MGTELVEGTELVKKGTYVEKIGTELERIGTELVKIGTELVLLSKCSDFKKIPNSVQSTNNRNQWRPCHLNSRH